MREHVFSAGCSTYVYSSSIRVCTLINVVEITATYMPLNN